MQKTILITGSTDGLGLEAARKFASLGHHVWLHGRNRAKLNQVKEALSAEFEGAPVDALAADLSVFEEVEAMARAAAEEVGELDVLINNAGVFVAPDPVTQDGLDVRFVVNTIAPYLLTQRLKPRLGPLARVINLSSAAQSPVDLNALRGEVRLPDGPAYAQSKLALTMWSRAMAQSQGVEGPAIVAVNPGSMLGTKMVKEAYGVRGSDIGIGVEILRRAALTEEFQCASGKYFDNDSGRFASPHPDALDHKKTGDVVQVIESILNSH